MKKIPLLLVVLFFSVSIFAQQGVKVPLKVPLKVTENSFEVLNKSSQNLTVKSSLSTLYLSQEDTKKGMFTQLVVANTIKVFDVGNPNIPVISKLIEVPQNAEVTFNIVSYDEEIINLSEYGIKTKIIPAQRSISKSEDPIDVPFVINSDVYNTDSYTNKNIAVYQDAGMLRATRFGRVEISPIQYNPVKNQIRVLNNLVVEIKFVGADLAKTQALKQKYSSPNFDRMLEDQVMNYKTIDSKELIGATTHMVIVSDRMFESQLASFIEWKELKGFDVTTAYTDDIGTTTSDIKSYLQGIYEGDNPMDFVLFVGDIQQVPAWSGNSGSHVTDLRYCEYTGDNLPEVFYGRFSAQNTSQLQPQIDKTLMYEKYEMSDPSYLSEVFIVAGDDSGWEMVHGNGAIWYADNYYMTEDNGINAHTYLQPLNNNEVSGIIFEDMNSGLAFANYTAHCSSSGWASPGFSTSDVNSLTNDEKYGLWIGNCCLSVKFDVDECFGEAALRKANGGAIGDIGGSNSTYWDEDYWWGVGMGTPVEQPNYDNFDKGVYDGVFHTLENEQGDISTWMPTQGQISVCGNLAVESSTSSRKEYYWEIYHLMGDPSLTNFIGVPSAITYSLNPAVLMIGSTSIDISTVPYGYIAIHQGGDRLAVAMADGSGNATIELSSAIVGGDVTMVITAQNKQPLIETLTPLASSEPYVTVSTYTPDNADFNSTAGIDVVFENIAGAEFGATNVVATLTTSDPYVTITDGTEDVGDVAGGATVEITNAFSISIANNVPDQHEVEFDVAISGDAKYEWNSTLDITLNAPVLEVAFDAINDQADKLIYTSTPITDVIISGDYNYDISIEGTTGNDNGMLEAGESAGITVITGNNGHTDLLDATCTLTSTSEYVTVNTGESYLGTIVVGAELPAVFTISIGENCPVGEAVELIFTLVGGEYHEEIVVNLPVGLQMEDFESGDFSSYDWTATDMKVQTDNVYAGTYVAHSTIENQHDETAVLELEVNVTADGTISFYKKVSSEPSYDYLRFYIDGKMQEQWAGEVDWSLSEYDVSTGVHTFAWKYDKDGSENGGDDCAWIDDIVFPGHVAAKGDTKDITITGETIPTWLTFVDYGDGTANLSGTSPSEIGTHQVVLSVNVDYEEPVIQDFEIAVGVQNISSLSETIEIYPNPSNGIFKVNLPSNNKVVNISITDITGKVVYKSVVNGANTYIDLSNNPQGIYLLKLEMNEEIINKKIILE